MLRQSFELAELSGLSFRFEETDLGEDAHPTQLG